MPDLGVTLGDFLIAAKLQLAEHWRSKSKDVLDWTTSVDHLELTVSCDEPDEPPPVVILQDGKRDLTVQQAYLLEKQPQYRAAAVTIANRILTFFRYALATPNITLFSERDQVANQATWIDDRGQELPVGSAVYMVPKVPGLQGQLGVSKLSPARLPDLELFLSSPSQPTLAATLLSEAQGAWFEGNLRRAVLDLAICAEVLVKRRFFVQDSPAGAAFDYLEDKAKVSVRVLELLDAVAKEAFGTSYKEATPNRYRSIDYLFRCRNKIAHRGELSLRDDSGKTIKADASMVEEWWNAVAHLLSWVESLR